MKITNVNIPAEALTQEGLPSIQMSNLGEVVLLTGANGAGKSRILRSVIAAANRKISNVKLNRQRQSLNSMQKAYASSKQENFLRQIKQIEKLLAADSWITTDKAITNQLTTFEFVPKQMNLQDCYNLSPQQLDSNASAIESILGIGNLATGAFAKIQSVQNAWWDVTHQNYSGPKEEKEKVIADYYRLKEILKTFLKADLERKNGHATLFNFRLGDTRLSDGQKILLQFCMGLFAQGALLDDCICFMDEPENHLHPEALVKTIHNLQLIAPNTQIWISTHSIPLLSHFDPNHIWFVENGKANYAGRSPQTVLKGLVGAEEEICKLESFLGLPNMFALTNYSLECLLPPTTSSETKDDQNKQIREILQRQREKNKQPLKILDYGAGQGRLLAAMREHLDPELNLAEHFDYIAFDPSEKDKLTCEKAIDSVYRSSTGRYFHSDRELKTNHSSKSFDLIILCNVFHEIDPKEWLNLFGPQEIVMTLLKDEGHLLIVEDHQIPKGELAHSKGFIVLDTLELNKLFNAKPNEIIVSDQRGDGRLKAHMIPKSILQNINYETRKDALKEISCNAKKEIVHLRKESAHYKNGLKHAFWVQQFANCELALTELG
jgi:ABC-type cobalamin/Fe3+-siderophores transport system ATPase subunit